MRPSDKTATEEPTTEHLLARLISVTCEVAKSMQRIEAQMDQLVDQLDSLIALAQQRSFSSNC